MKIARFAKLLLLALVLSITATACKKTPKSPTPIFGPLRPLPPKDGSPSEMANPGPTIPADTGPKVSSIPANPDGTIPPADRGDDLSNYTQDREAFRQQTVIFEFDRYNIKPSELPKLQTVASYLKSNPNEKLMVEGHCDERGTPEYNRALGECRALSARESLVNLGINADRIHTISYGEDKPVDPGHNEAAWSKNRRDEFVLLRPKTPLASAPTNQ